MAAATRRTWLKNMGLAGLGLAAAGAGIARSTFATGRAGQTRDIALAELRGTFDAGQHGVTPDASSRSARAFMDLLEAASKQRGQVFLPPGRYELSNIALPDFVHLTGVPGATTIAYSGEGRLFHASQTRSLRLSNIRFDGANRWLADNAPALMSFHDIDDLRIEDCEILGAERHALWLERIAGTVSANAITGAGNAAIFAVESRGLTIEANRIADCGNGGILVHRWKKADDGTIIRANRISGISAKAGGTGENGNGINVFQADNVSVSDNHVAACAFSAIRSNAGSNVRIAGNHCLESGETAIYSEFGFEGALVSGNLVDGAANGISVVNFDHGGRLASITGNIIRNLSLSGPYDNGESHFGIGLSAEADTVVSNNVIENAPRFAMALGWGPYLRNLVVSGNMVRNAPVGCAVSIVDGAGDCVIADNLFSNTPGAAIAGYRWLEQATGDLVAGDGPAPAHVTLSGNRKSNDANG